MDIKQEETSEPVDTEEEEEDFPGNVNSPTIMAEQDQINYICVCPLLDTFYEYPILCNITYCVEHCLSVCLSMNK